MLFVFSNFRKADYGFEKLGLIKLFEAISTTVEITKDVDGKRILQLTNSMITDTSNSIPKKDQIIKSVSRFAEECTELLKNVPECKLHVDKFVQAYWERFRRTFRY